MNKDIFVVLLAGGSGERLWPLSRAHHPKQFLALTGKQTMLEDTLDRVEKLSKNCTIWCITAEKYKDKIKEYGGERIETYLFEPVSRNTAPAILYSCLQIADINPEATVVFLPTDHFIPETQKFILSMTIAVKHANDTHTITLLGLTPSYAATGYGYIEIEKNYEMARGYSIRNFYEKPSKEKAEEFFALGTMLWNLGIFCGPVKLFLDSYKKHAPALFDTIQKYPQDTKVYETLPNISFDYAILENLENISVIPSDFSWSDVGDIATFLSFKNLAQTGIFSVNAHNNLVHSTKKIVALADVDNLCIVETADALLVLPKEKAQKVKYVLELIKLEKEFESIL